MDQYSPTYSNDRAAKDQTALLAALIALLLAALAVVFVLGQQGSTASSKEGPVATPVAEVQHPVTALAGSFAGLLVAPTDGPVQLVGGAANTSYPALAGRVTALLQTEVGLWAAVAGSGETPAEVVLVRNAVGATPFIQHIALPQNVAGAEIRAIESGLGRLWIGTSKGLLTYDWGRFNPFTPASRFRVPGMGTMLDVTSLYLDQVGTLWIGTKDGVLSYNGSEAFRHGTKEGVPDAWVTALAGDNTGLLYCGTDRGLASYDRGVWVRQAEFSDHVNCIFAAEDNVWVGTESGVYQRLEGKWSELGADTKLPPGPVTAMAWAPDGLYAASVGGLYKIAVNTAVAATEKERAHAAETASPAPLAPPPHGR